MAVPKVINSVGTAYARNGQATFSACIPEATLANLGAIGGNCVVVLAQASVASSMSVTDDSGGLNTWQTAVSPVSLNGQLFAAFYALNVAAGTKRITVTPNDPGSNFVQMHLIQVNNVASVSVVDGTPATAASAGPNPAAGSMTTTADGDIIFTFWGNTTRTDPGHTSFTAGNSATLENANPQEGVGCQVLVQGTHGAINSTFTVGGANNTDTFGIVSFALKSASSGADASLASRIRRIQHVSFFGSAFTSCATQFPATGDAVLSSNDTFEPGGAAWVASAADNKSNAWNLIAKNLASPSSGTPSMLWAPLKVAGSDLRITFTMNAATSNVFMNVFVLYDLIGLQFENFSLLDGNQTSNGDLNAGSITPTFGSGCAFNVCGINAHTLTDLITAGGVADMTGNTSGDGSDGTANADNGWGHVPYAANSQITFNYSTQPAGNTGVAQWSSISATFSAPPIIPSRDNSKQVSMSQRAMR